LDQDFPVLSHGSGRRIRQMPAPIFGFTFRIADQPGINPDPSTFAAFSMQADDVASQ
jgi:hypothetical protein